MKKEWLRALPKVDEILKHPKIEQLMNEYPRIAVIKSIRNSLDYIRQEILNDRLKEMIRLDGVIDRISIEIEKNMNYSLQRVINGTGVIIHTNLGRSLLSEKVIKHVSEIASGYSTLEYNAEAGERGLRYTHIERLIMDLTGAEGALVVNNNAAAVMLALSTVAYGKEVIVSRGELVEIGGSFRVPEVMKISGAQLVEVGTTNKTHYKDFKNAINEETGAILKVHTSNYRIVGFTQEVEVEDLVKLSNEENIPVVMDLGSGTFIDLTEFGLSKEPTVLEQVSKGIDVLTFSGDKLLGGPQAGIIVGKKKYIDQIKKNQLTRALRVDKMTISALEATLLSYFDLEEAKETIPTLNMITQTYDQLINRANCLYELITHTSEVELIDGESQIGGGTYPIDRLKSVMLAINPLNISVDQFSYQLRMLKTPIISRIANERIILDIRTLLDQDFEYIATSINELLES